MALGVNFTPGSAREIARTVEKVRTLFPPNPTGGSNATVPLWLAKTTASHAANASQDVTLMTGAKGSETERTGDTVEAFSRYKSYDSGELVIVGLIGEGWEIIAPFDSGDTIDTGCTCGECGLKSLALLDGGGFGVYPLYGISFSSPSTVIGGPVEYDDVGSFSGDEFDWDCGPSDTRSVHLVMTGGIDPGDLTVSLVDDSDNVLGTWKNVTTAWRPWCSIRLYLYSYSDDGCADLLPTCICVTPATGGGCDCGDSSYMMKAVITGNVSYPATNGTWLCSFRGRCDIAGNLSGAGAFCLFSQSKGDAVVNVIVPRPGGVTAYVRDKFASEIAEGNIPGGGSCPLSNIVSSPLSLSLVTGGGTVTIQAIEV